MEHLGVILDCKLSTLEAKFDRLSREISQIHGDIARLHGCMTGCKCSPYHGSPKCERWQEKYDDRTSVIHFFNGETGRVFHQSDEHSQHTSGHYTNMTTGRRCHERETPSSTTSSSTLLDSGCSSTQHPLFDYDSEGGSRTMEDYCSDGYGKFYHPMERSTKASPEYPRKVDDSVKLSLYNGPSTPLSSKSTIFFPSALPVDSTLDTGSATTSTSENINFSEIPTRDRSSSTERRTSANTPSLAKKESPSDVDYVLPEKVTAVEVIDLWEKGGENFPPIKSWTAKQKLKQKSKVSRWRKLVQIYYDKYKGVMENFVRGCTDKQGQQFTVSAILNSHREEDGTDVDVEWNDPRTNSRPVNSTGMSVSKGSTIHKPRYILPRKLNGNQVSALDIITLWEEGIGNVPPIRLWPPIQKMKQQSKISRWRKIIKLYKSECEGNLDRFREKYTDELGKPYSVGKIIALKRRARSSSSSSR